MRCEQGGLKQTVKRIWNQEAKKYDAYNVHKPEAMKRHNARVNMYLKLGYKL